MKDLQEELTELLRKKHAIEQKIKKVKQSLFNQHKIEIEEALEAKEEPYGDVTIGDVTFKMPKNVRWDQEKLFNLACSLPNPKDWVDFKLSVTETKFKAMPHYLKDSFKKARSIKGGTLSIKLKGEK